VPLLLRALDVAVIASLWEATPLTGFEALAAGCALVATRVDGLAEVLEDERTALLVPPADPRALAAAIARLLSDAELRARLGAAARKESGRYSIDAHVERLTRVYEAVAAEARR
jgi:glycosyltransferase involved in cell wall biosynthesis